MTKYVCHCSECPVADVPTNTEREANETVAIHNQNAHAGLPVATVITEPSDGDTVTENE